MGELRKRGELVVAMVCQIGRRALVVFLLLGLLSVGSVFASTPAQAEVYTCGNTSESIIMQATSNRPTILLIMAPVQPLLPSMELCATQLLVMPTSQMNIQ